LVRGVAVRGVRAFPFFDCGAEVELQIRRPGHPFDCVAGRFPGENLLEGPARPGCVTGPECPAAFGE